MLKTIHSISPEQNGQATNAEKAKQILERLKKAPPVPASLDNYKEQLRRFSEAQLAFYEGLAAAKKSKKIDDLITATQPQLQGRKAKEFTVLCRKLDAKTNIANWDSNTIEQITEAYSLALDGSPEEEFHRAIKKLNITYTCAFGE